MVSRADEIGRVSARRNTPNTLLSLYVVLPTGCGARVSSGNAAGISFVTLPRNPVWCDIGADEHPLREARDVSTLDDGRRIEIEHGEASVHALCVSDDGTSLGSGRVPSHCRPGMESVRWHWPRLVWSDPDFIPGYPHQFPTIYALNPYCQGRGGPVRQALRQQLGRYRRQETAPPRASLHGCYAMLS